MPDPTLPDPKAELKKKIEQLSQWQGLCWIPVIVPLFLGLNSRPIAPDRVVYVLIFRISVILLAAIVFIVLQFKKSKLKTQLTALERMEASGASEPPIPLPR